MFTGKHLVKRRTRRRRRRSCHLYQVLLESSRFILKPFDLRGLRSDIFKVFLNGKHCTAHIAHSVTKCGDWSPPIWKGRLVFMAVYSLLHTTHFCSLGLYEGRSWDTELDWTRTDNENRSSTSVGHALYIKNKASQVNTSIHLKKSSY